MNYPKDKNLCTGRFSNKLNLWVCKNGKRIDLKKKTSIDDNNLIGLLQEIRDRARNANILSIRLLQQNNVPVGTVNPEPFMVVDDAHEYGNTLKEEKRCKLWIIILEKECKRRNLHFVFESE